MRRIAAVILGTGACLMLTTTTATTALANPIAPKLDLRVSSLELKLGVEVPIPGINVDFCKLGLACPS